MTKMRKIFCLLSLAFANSSFAKQTDSDSSKSGESSPSWQTSSGYPTIALRNEWEGTAEFKVRVGTDGRVKDCVITRSSGYAVLDEATCKQITQRARFRPARDKSGNPIEGTFSNKMNWVINKKHK